MSLLAQAAPTFNPDGWDDVVVYLMYAIPGIVAATAAWIAARNAKATKAEVKNGHRTNIRDDITTLSEMVADIKDRQAGIKTEVTGLRKDLGGLREEIREEREARGDLERRVREAIKRRWPW